MVMQVYLDVRFVCYLFNDCGQGWMMYTSLNTNPLTLSDTYTIINHQITDYREHWNYSLHNK